MKLVPLSKGAFAKVDDEDYDRVMQFKWQYAATGRHKKKHAYAQRAFREGGKRRTVMMHRFILGHDAPATDHEDGDGLNNQRYNLRPATRVENGRNREIQPHSSKFKGVTFFAGKWVGIITFNKKNHYLGRFVNEIDAAQAYDAAALKHHGAFAKTNQQLGVY